MRKKRFLSMAMAAWMAAAMAVPAFAADPSVSKPANASGPTELTVGKDGIATEGVTATLTGTISATHINVTVPSNVPFSLDPTIAISGSGVKNPVTDQVTTYPESVQIINSSVVPVYAKISSVKAEDKDKKDNTITLTNKTSDVEDTSKQKYIMFGFKKKGDITDFNTPGDWLGNGSQSALYPLSKDGGRMEAVDTKTPNANILEMQVYAYAKYGWYMDETFTITPTIVVSAKPFS